MKRVLLLLTFIILVICLTDCSKTIGPLKLQGKSGMFEDVLIKIGSEGGQQKTLGPAGGSISLPLRNGIIPVFVEAKCQILLSKKNPMNVSIQPPSWHFESKNWPNGATYYFIIRLDDSAPLTGEVTLSEIRGANGEILIDKPIKINMTVVR